MSESEQAKIGALERFKPGKGITREAEGAWTKEYIEIEVKLPENAFDQDFVAKFTATEGMIDQLLQAPATAAPTEKKPVQHQPKITMTPDEIDKLPWVASNWVRKGDADRNAKPMEDAWIKLENSDSRLIPMIDEAPDGKLSLPPYEFEFKTFADSSTKLIVRRGPKEKKKG
jgi:hypothetical protein